MSQLSVDSITGRVAGTSPTFPNGLNVTGILTATVTNQNITGATSFQGSTTFDNGFSVTGVVTASNVSVASSVTANEFYGDGSSLSGIDASSLKDGSNVKVQAVSGGANVTGDLGVSGNATVTGNLTVSGTTTTLNTATLDVEDKNITLNAGSGDTSGSADGAGITIQDACLLYTSPSPRD